MFQMLHSGNMAFSPTQKISRKIFPLVARYNVLRSINIQTANDPRLANMTQDRYLQLPRGPLLATTHHEVVMKSVCVSPVITVFSVTQQWMYVCLESITGFAECVKHFHCSVFNASHAISL